MTGPPSRKNGPIIRLYTHQWLEFLFVDKTEFRDEVVEMFVTRVHMRLLIQT